MRAADISLHTRSGFRTARLHLRADVVAAYFTADGRQLKTIEARGNVLVRILTDDEGKNPVGFGESATYDSVSECVLLGGWPEVRIGEEKITADSPSTLLLVSQNGVRKIEPGASRQTQARRLASIGLVTP